VGSGVTIAVTTRDRPVLTLLAVASARAAAPKARVIVVDSGSSPENLEQLRAGLGPVELHVGSYSNAAATRNAALALSDSDLVGFLDSDDLMRPEKITCLEPILRRHGDVVLAVGRTEVIDVRGVARPDLTKRQISLYEETERVGTSYPGQCIRFTAFTSATLMRRAALEQVGGYDESLPAMEDVDLYLRLALVGRVETARCIAASYRVWNENVDAARSAEGMNAVATKHLASLPSLPKRERKTAECALCLRSALSLRTLMQSTEARRMLARAGAADPWHAFSSKAFWRLLAASFVPRKIVQR
jgi:GT2 family glycosyltransferase